jgi:teichuronic acid biosynthesis glycosyltransferase TuaG
MPSYNCGKFVEETIHSVQAQTYQNWEIIFVDDNSTDDTVAKLSELRNRDNRIHLYLNKTNMGAAVSRNNALRKARGRWIAFLDSDDVWYPEKLEKQIQFMEENNYSFSYHNTEDMDENGKLKGVYWTGPKHINKTDMFNYDWIGCLTVMYDANKVGLIQIADIKKNNDYAMWLKAIRKCDCYLLDEILAKYRIRKGSISNQNKIKLIKWHYIMFRVSEGQNPLVASFNTVRNLIFGVIKKYMYKRKK